MTSGNDDIDAITESLPFDQATATAGEYLNSAIEIIEVRSLVRDRLDWAEVRRAAHESLGNTADTTDFSRGRTTPSRP